MIARIAAHGGGGVETKARTQLFIEKVEQRYSLGMVAATVLLFAVPLLAGEALQASLLRAMTFMIVASPCAVVLATMPPLLAAMANAGRHGVLVKSAVAMEQGGRDRRGRVRQDRHPDRGNARGWPPSACCPAAGASEQQILALAAAAENPSASTRWPGRSSPPRADAGPGRAGRRPSSAPLPGRGVTAQVGGHAVRDRQPRRATALERARRQRRGRRAARKRRPDRRRHGRRRRARSACSASLTGSARKRRVDGRQ